MRLSVHVLGRESAVLESVGDFKSVVAYHPDTPENDFISLTMPVRTESYVWDDQLPPVLQMNLPEGYLLQVLQEQFGPQIGANPIALLSIIGRNMVGRIQVAAAGATLIEPPKPIEVAELLQGDNSEQAFAELVRQHATSGVSGVLPKFLDTEVEHETAPVPSEAGEALNGHRSFTAPCGPVEPRLARKEENLSAHPVSPVSGLVSLGLAVVGSTALAGSASRTAPEGAPLNTR
jgi:serine/threonine-protein kinase HipA